MAPGGFFEVGRGNQARVGGQGGRWGCPRWGRPPARLAESAAFLSEMGKAPCPGVAPFSRWGQPPQLSRAWVCAPGPQRTLRYVQHQLCLRTPLPHSSLGQPGQWAGASSLGMQLGLDSVQSGSWGCSSFSVRTGFFPSDSACCGTQGGEGAKGSGVSHKPTQHAGLGQTDPLPRFPAHLPW